jgi:hypothetical protein
LFDDSDNNIDESEECDKTTKMCDHNNEPGETTTVDKAVEEIMNSWRNRDSYVPETDSDSESDDKDTDYIVSENFGYLTDEISFHESESYFDKKIVEYMWSIITRMTMRSHDELLEYGFSNAISFVGIIWQENI